MTYDLLEDGGADIRARPLSDRRPRLRQSLLASPATAPAPLAGGGRALLDGAGRAPRRGAPPQRGRADAEAPRLALRRGRRRGDWWKWKIDPFTVDTVMIYAHPGSGRRATLFTDYTFGVWHEGQLVPVAKAYSGLSDEEILELDAWIRRHTIEKFGPTRTWSRRRSSRSPSRGSRPRRATPGVAVRFPRMLRWRKDKPPRKRTRWKPCAGCWRDARLRLGLWALRSRLCWPQARFFPLAPGPHPRGELTPILRLGFTCPRRRPSAVLGAT